MTLMNVGVLAFQGDFAEHMAVLKMLHVHCLEVRSLADLAKVDHLIIPGGESTVITKFLRATGVGDEVVRRVKKAGKMTKPLAVFGTCAGAIVVARKVTGKRALHSLGLIDIAVDRNAYGTQVESFEARIKIRGFIKPFAVSFIRAPKIAHVGREVEVLASQKGNPILVRQGNVLVSRFHTEVRGETRIHEMFLKMKS
jgi:5'-phosphate synthase pdxT subunit